MCKEDGIRAGETRQGKLTRGNRPNDPSVSPDHQYADLKAKPSFSACLPQSGQTLLGSSNLTERQNEESKKERGEGGREVHVYDLLRVEGKQTGTHTTRPAAE